MQRNAQKRRSHNFTIFVVLILFVVLTCVYCSWNAELTGTVITKLVRCNRPNCAACTAGYFHGPNAYYRYFRMAKAVRRKALEIQENSHKKFEL